jgi:hypothetical protein
MARNVRCESQAELSSAESLVCRLPHLTVFASRPWFFECSLSPDQERVIQSDRPGAK